MVITTNLVDLSKITLENYNTYKEKIIYEVTRQYGVSRKVLNSNMVQTAEERKQAIKEYQHNYYLKVTKPRRQEERKNVKQYRRRYKDIRRI